MNILLSTGIVLLLLLTACSRPAPPADSSPGRAEATSSQMMTTKAIAPPLPLAESSKWRMLESGHFKVMYYENEQPISKVSQSFETIYSQVSEWIKHPPGHTATEKINVYVLNEAEMSALFGPNISGYWRADGLYLNALLLHHEDRSKIYRVFRHELIHGTTYDNFEAKASGMPMWAIEGVAHYYDYEPPYSGENRFEAEMRNAVLNRTLLSWSQLTWEPNILDYAEAWSIWGWLAEQHGSQLMIDLFFKSGSFIPNLEKMTNKSVSQLELDWKKHVNARYGS